MTQTAVASPVTPAQARRWLTPSAALWLALLALLLVAYFRAWLWRMGLIATSQWGGDWSHAPLIPLLSLWMVAQRRQALSRLRARPCWPAATLLIASLFSYAWWVYPGRNDMLQGYSLVLAVLGLAWLVLGGAMTRVLAAPILYLVLAVKVSDRLWDQLAWPLQLLAARCATVALNIIGLFTGLEAQVRGSTIELSAFREGQWLQHALTVAEACSGLRMLAAFVALGAAVAFLTPRPAWQRVVLLLLAVPVAVAVNVGRVTALGLLVLVDGDLARGDFHQFIGLIMLVPALGLFMLAGWVLDRVVIYEPEPGDQPATATTADVAPPRAMVASSSSSVPALALGAAVMLCVGGGYLLLLALARPDLAPTWLSAGRSGALLALVAVALLGVLAVGRRKLAGASSLAAAAFAVGVLGVAVLGLSATLTATRAVLIKQPVPLRQPLYLLPRELAGWRLVQEDPPLGPDLIEALGTRQYVSRTYQVEGWPTDQPGGRVRLHVAYYTGTPDTVPHVPERCFVAAGAAPTALRAVTLTLPTDAWRRDEAGPGWWADSRLGGAVRVPESSLSATAFAYRFDAADAGPPSHVVYFFSANGRFLASPQQVRLAGFRLTDRHSYYCKIEVGLPGVSDADEAAKQTSAFLAVMLPEVLACLPDWTEVTSTGR